MRLLKKLIPARQKCPHCGTVYRRGDLSGLVLKRSESCYHCGKEFRVRKSKLIVLLIELIILGIAADLIAMNLVTSVVALFVINVVIVLIGLLMIPFYIELNER